MNRRERREQTARIVDAARKQLGYHAQPQKRNGFAPARYDGHEWNGAFVQRVLRDAFDGEPEVSFLSTVTALSYYAARNRLYRKPRVGDIVFYTFSADPGEWDRQPHIGVVTELRPDGFRAIEGQTFSGKPQGIQLADGVHERDRFTADILAVVRPVPARTVTVSGEPARIRMSYFDSNGKTVARAVETVQLALNRARTAWTFNRGKRDGLFRSAFGAYSRENGHVENRGELTVSALRTLGSETGVFEVDNNG